MDSNAPSGFSDHVSPGGLPHERARKELPGDYRSVSSRGNLSIFTGHRSGLGARILLPGKHAIVSLGKEFIVFLANLASTEVSRVNLECSHTYCELRKQFWASFRFTHYLEFQYFWSFSELV